MSNLPDFVYNGSEPFIFVSYAHQDRDIVAPLVRGLQRQGFRVWFDVGIEHGSLWAEALAQKLTSCHCILFFLSPDSAVSHHCRNEISFATSHGKRILTVYLRECTLSSGLEFQLGCIQALRRSDFHNDTLLLEALCREPLLKPCLDSDDAAAEKELAEFDPFIIALGNVIQACESRQCIVNPQRLQEFQEAYRILETIAEENGALLTYKLHEPFKSMGSISLQGADLVFENPEALAKAISLASNMEVYPLTDGTIRMGFAFHGLTQPIPD